MKNTTLAALLILLVPASLAGQVREKWPATGPVAVRTALFTPCPRDEICPPHEEDGVPRGVYLVMGGVAGALVGGVTTQSVCDKRKRDAPEREEGCENQRFAVFSGAAAGALVGLGASAFVYRMSKGNVYTAAATARPVDLVTFQIPIGG